MHRERVLSQGTFPHVPSARLFGVAAEVGFDAINVWRTCEGFLGVADTRSSAANAGVKVDAVCRGGWITDGAQSIAETHRALDDAAELGARQLVVYTAPKGAGERTDPIHLRAVLETVLPAAIDRGVKLALEPFHPFLSVARSALVTLRSAMDIVDAVGSAWLGVAVDSYHVAWDPDFAEVLRRDGRHIASVHLADWVTPQENVLRARALPGEGVIDFRSFLDAVEGAGYTGPFELEVLTDRFESVDIERSLRALMDSFDFALDPPVSVPD
jgi:sugar phosphate isomerase/epimerase